MMGGNSSYCSNKQMKKQNAKVQNESNSNSTTSQKKKEKSVIQQSVDSHQQSSHSLTAKEKENRSDSLQSSKQQLDNKEQLKQQQKLEVFYQLNEATISIEQIIQSLHLESSFLNQNQDRAWLQKSKIPNFRGQINLIRQRYYQPIGYYGIGLSLNYGDDKKWINSNDSEDTWVVLYHKTRPEHVLPILTNGFKIGPNQQISTFECRFGRGIIGNGVYFADVIQYTLAYGSNLILNGHEIQIILQCRVKPSSIKSPNSNIYVVANTSDIRPYRILIKKI